MTEVPHFTFDSEIDASSLNVLENVRNAKLSTRVQDSRGNQISQVGEVAYTFGLDNELIVIDGRYDNACGTDQIENLTPELKSQLLPPAAKNAQRRARSRG